MERTVRQRAVEVAAIGDGGRGGVAVVRRAKGGPEGRARRAITPGPARKVLRAWRRDERAPEGGPDGERTAPRICSIARRADHQYRERAERMPQVTSKGRDAACGPPAENGDQPRPARAVPSPRRPPPEAPVPGASRSNPRREHRFEHLPVHRDEGEPEDHGCAARSHRPGREKETSRFAERDARSQWAGIRGAARR